MKKMKLAVLGMSLLTLVSCGSATGNGALIGTGAGAALGALAGRLIGGNTKGTIIGTAVGSAVGATAGSLIGKHMDKVKAQAAAAAQNATIENIVDVNGLPAIRVTFDSGILFATGKYNLNETAKAELAKFANVMKNNTDCSIGILGYTDSTGSDATNQTLSENRAKSVQTYLNSCGVTNNQIQTVQGFGENPAYLIMGADGKEDLAASRRVEVVMYASQAMIDAANAGTLN
ncbi:MAG: OmpA family protein [Prevotellaceae bacterium]|nr:OmpA family protein [Prevotellaceae bacterium]